MGSLDGELSRESLRSGDGERGGVGTRTTGWAWSLSKSSSDILAMSFTAAVAAAERGARRISMESSLDSPDMLVLMWGLLL
ncbi:unnamed protein product [Chondrus crispus]|uniref:Uncharacterized protein n=1 Tax=Chondrus crispus TaxID=2769 RepID=R7QH68_CHOCR|nr:unnamed protein product [Chondrus crispus]CDF37867.1 unnamed protein product [Chondrus crispus]|eukprot:XP_005717738.1 unnamed protein product [Chondrus crispus]